MRIGWRMLAGGFLLAAGVMGAEAGAPVVFEGKPLFTLQQKTGPFSPQDRAEAIAGRLERVLHMPGAKIRVVPDEPGGLGTEIDGGDIPLMVVTDQDALAAGTSRQALAAEYAGRMEAAVERARESRSIRTWAIDTLLALLFVGLFFGALRGQAVLFRRFRVKLHSWRGTRIQGLRVQRVELLSAGRITAGLITATRIFQAVAILLFFYLFLSLVLGILPETRGISAALLAYIAATLAAAWRGVTAALPGLFMIVLIGVATWYIVRLCRLLFHEVEVGHLTIPGFYPEWAEPTYKLVRVLVVVFAAIVAFPYVPGGNSPAFKGISIFFGVLVSFGSAGAVGNLVAGILLTYSRAFHVGDIVRISDTMGRITECTLLATHLRTIKNEDVTVPNSLVLSGQVFNFSGCCRDGALILHTSVSIGYDAPWRQVHELLIAAALRTPKILPDPKPFVLQTALDDFYVNYQINAYTTQPVEMMQIYSDLHQNIQDEFNNAGVEICSPHFSALRDGNRIAIPDEYVAKDYMPPSFRVSENGPKEQLRGGAGARRSG